MMRLLTLVLGYRWAIRREAVPALFATATPIEAEGATAASTQGRTSSSRAGSVAVIPMFGVITHRDSYFARVFGWPTVEGMRAAFRQAMADETISAIVFECDSPGGTVDGVPEFADEIYAARGSKPIIAVSNTLCCSAAYWLASQADRVIASPSSETGSIGVYTLHHDYSEWEKQHGIKTTLIYAGKNKVDANPYEPLSDEAREILESSVNEVRAEFWAAVARGRGVSVSDVKAYGEGKVYNAREAKKLGVVDVIGTVESAVLRIGGRRGRTALAEDWDQPMVVEALEAPMLVVDQARVDRDQALLSLAQMEIEALQ